MKMLLSTHDGVLAYVMLSDELPFPGDPSVIQGQILGDSPEGIEVQGCPQEASKAVSRCLVGFLS
jgi:hypothetical protein